MGAPRKYSPELQERATRMAVEARRDPDRARGARKHVIRQELERRLRAETPQVASAPTQDLMTHRRVVVITWAELLKEIRVALEAAGDSEGVEDLNQLQGLCDRADAEAMLPLTEEDTDPVLARRYGDYADLARSVGNLLLATPAVSGDQLRSSDGGWGVGRYLRAADGSVFWFGFYPRYWQLHHPTPWWMQFTRRTSPEAVEVLRQLALAQTIPYVGQDDGMAIVAVPAPLGTEADDAARQMAQFVSGVCQALGARKGQDALDG